MHRQDYILRMIEQLGRILVAIRRMLVGGDTSGVDRKLRDAVSGVGLDLDLARRATPETLALLVAPTGEVEPGRCWLLAETLLLDGMTAELEGRQADARDRLLKARSLFSMLEPGGVYLTGFPEAEERIREIEGRLEGMGEGA